MKKLITLCTLLLCAVVNVCADETVLFSWRSDGSTTALETALTATGGTAAFYGTDAPGTESASYNGAVTDNNLKASGSRGHKFGKNATYLKVTLTSGYFQAGDIIYICGYNPMRVGTGVSSDRANTDLAESLATGTSKTDYNVGSVTIPNTIAANVNTIYVSRANGSGTGLAAIKIVRQISAYQVTYQSGAGTGSDVVSETSRAEACPNTFTAPTGLVFAGWKDGSGNSYAVGDVVPNDITLIAQWGKITNTVFYSMTSLVGPTEDVAAGTTESVEATFVNGSAEVHNGHSSSAAKMIFNDKINLKGSGNSYFIATIADGSVQAGDILDVGEPGDVIINGSASKVTERTFPYTILSSDAGLIGKNKLYIYRNNSSEEDIAEFPSFTITRPVIITKVATPTYELGAWDDESGKYTITLACETDGATINYSIDNKASYSEYSSALTLTPGTTLDAYAVYAGLENSDAIVQFTVPAAPTLRTVTFNKGEGDGTAPATLEDVVGGTSFTFPAAPLLYKEGKTLTAWNDGSADHAVGSSIEIADNLNLTAVFTDNTVALGDAATVVKWDFTTDGGAPNMAYEGAGNPDEVLSQRVIIGETPFDALMHIDASAGKLNNTNNPSYAQVNPGTKFTIPAVYNMVVTYKYNQTPTNAEDATFAGDNADVFDTSARTLTYTYKGLASTIDIVQVAEGKYPEYISVAYPVAITKHPIPTIVAESKFNFENKGFKVTITATDGTLKVSTDGENYIEQTSPYVTYATATTHYYAKAEGVLTASDIADKEVTNTFDPAKRYVAWVYTKGYGTKEYAFETDPMVTALQADYNVVEVNYSESTTPSDDLNNAHLIVCTEAMAGGRTMSNGMKAFAGVTPMIGLKAFNYTKGRWSWGAPANPGSTTQAFTPKSNLYKVLNGVAFESDGSTIKLATAESGNVIQTVEFGNGETVAPDGNVILGTLGGDDAKAVMYISNKYFGLGLSSDCWASYTANAVTIVKNAAAMLIADEPLDAEVATVSGEITASGFNTFSSSYPLDLSTISNATAYVASNVEYDKVVLVKTTDKVAAGEGLLLAGTAGAEFTIAVTTDAATLPAGNLLVGLPAGGEAPVGSYVFAWPTADPSAASFYIVETTPAALGAGKAYLDTAAGGGARLSLSFGEDAGEATGISEMKSVKADGAIFNLRGQRVAQPQKGLYILNGKKTIVK